MPLLNGLDAGRQIKQSIASIELVFVTMNEDPDLAAEALPRRRLRLPAEAVGRVGAADRDPRGDEAPLVRHAARDRRDAGFADARGGPRSPPRQLTARQREVLQLLAEGKSMKEVAVLLNVAPRTVAFHKYRMMEQLKIKTNAELIQFAIRQHIV